jgi:TM2 domain-containing membrane protein YozV
MIIGEDIYKKKERFWRWSLYSSTILSSIIIVLYAVYQTMIFYNSLLSLYCNEPLLADYVSCDKMNSINIPYYNILEMFGGVLLGIFAIIQIISFFKLKKIYKYNFDNNIIRSNTKYTKKKAYISIALLFGTLGLHKFYAKKQIEGSIFVIVFIGSMIYQPLLMLLVITTAVSYADVAIAMAQKADHNKNILI